MWPNYPDALTANESMQFFDDIICRSRPNLYNSPEKVFSIAFNIRITPWDLEPVDLLSSVPRNSLEDSRILRGRAAGQASQWEGSIYEPKLASQFWSVLSHSTRFLAIVDFFHSFTLRPIDSAIKQYGTYFARSARINLLLDGSRDVAQIFVGPAPSCLHQTTHFFIAHPTSSPPTTHCAHLQ
jgi:hypothetical protein